VGFVIPDVDIWLRGLSRQHPDPKIVYRLGEHVKKRELILANSVRRAVLAQTRDDRQLARLGEGLSGFPEVAPRRDDDIEAARLVQDMRAKGFELSMDNAVLWNLARRLKAKIWSADPLWRQWALSGCPVLK
jgi:hypothetical protein